jgi:aarF domain-containing kinase
MIKSLNNCVSLLFIIIGATLFTIGYALLPSNRRKDVKCITESSIRFARSIGIGMTISIDYLIGPIMGYTESEIHQRSADRIIHGCMRNGGVYIKVGQGLAAVNHILPKEYTETLSILQVLFYHFYIDIFVILQL